MGRREPSILAAVAAFALVAGCSSGAGPRAVSTAAPVATAAASPGDLAASAPSSTTSPAAAKKAVGSAVPAPGAAGDGFFTENFAWRGTHAAFVGSGSTVWWNRDNWDIHADTHHIDVYGGGYDNKGSATAPYNDSQPSWPWKGFHVDIHKVASTDPRDGRPDNSKATPGGDGSSGAGIMHLDFQGIVSARLRNPVLISAAKPAEISFYAPKFVTTGFWWEVAISPATEIVGAENTMVPARTVMEQKRFESLPSPYRNDTDQGGSTNGPGHRDWVSDSINLVSTGYTDQPECPPDRKEGWHIRFGALKTSGGKTESAINSIDSLEQLPSIVPADRYKLVPWKIVFRPDHITLSGDLDGDGRMEVHGDYAMQVPWPEVFVHLIGAMYEGDHHPKWGCGYNQDGNGVTQVAELPWREVRIGPVKYRSTAAFPRESTGSNVPRSAGFMSYDIRDIGRHGPAQQGLAQANTHAYDKYSEYAWCWPPSTGIECGDQSRARQDVPLKLTLTADDLGAASLARIVADVRYNDPIGVDVNGKPAGSLQPVISKRDDFEREAWVRRGVIVDKTLLHAGENTITLHLGASSEIDRIELEIART